MFSGTQPKVQFASSNPINYEEADDYEPDYEYVQPDNPTPYNQGGQVQFRSLDYPKDQGINKLKVFSNVNILKIAKPTISIRNNTYTTSNNNNSNMKSPSYNKNAIKAPSNNNNNQGKDNQINKSQDRIQNVEIPHAAAVLVPWDEDNGNEYDQYTDFEEDDEIIKIPNTDVQNKGNDHKLNNSKKEPSQGKSDAFNRKATSTTHKPPTKAEKGQESQNDEDNFWVNFVDYNYEEYEYISDSMKAPLPGKQNLSKGKSGKSKNGKKAQDLQSDKKHDDITTTDNHEKNDINEPDSLNETIQGTSKGKSTLSNDGNVDPEGKGKPGLKNNDYNEDIKTDNNQDLHAGKETSSGKEPPAEKQNPQIESISDENLEQSSQQKPGSIHNGEHNEDMKTDINRESHEGKETYSGNNQSEEKQNPQKESINDGNLEQSSRGKPGSIHNGEHNEDTKTDNNGGSHEGQETNTGNNPSVEKQNPQTESINDGNLEQSRKPKPGSIHIVERNEDMKTDNNGGSQEGQETNTGKNPSVENENPQKESISDENLEQSSERTQGSADDDNHGVWKDDKNNKDVRAEIEHHYDNDNASEPMQEQVDGKEDFENPDSHPSKNKPTENVDIGEQNSGNHADSEMNKNIDSNFHNDNNPGLNSAKKDQPTLPNGDWSEKNDQAETHNTEAEEKQEMYQTATKKVGKKEEVAFKKGKSFWMKDNLSDNQYEGNDFYAVAPKKGWSMENFHTKKSKPILANDNWSGQNDQAENHNTEAEEEHEMYKEAPKKVGRKEEVAFKKGKSSWPNDDLSDEKLEGKDFYAVAPKKGWSKGNFNAKKDRPTIDDWSQKDKQVETHNTEGEEEHEIYQTAPKKFGKKAEVAFKKGKSSWMNDNLSDNQYEGNYVHTYAPKKGRRKGNFNAKKDEPKWSNDDWSEQDEEPETHNIEVKERPNQIPVRDSFLKIKSSQNDEKRWKKPAGKISDMNSWSQHIDDISNSKFKKSGPRPQKEPFRRGEKPSLNHQKESTRRNEPKNVNHKFKNNFKTIAWKGNHKAKSGKENKGAQKVQESRTSETNINIYIDLFLKGVDSTQFPYQRSFNKDALLIGNQQQKLLTDLTSQSQQNHYKSANYHFTNPQTKNSRPYLKNDQPLYTQKKGMAFPWINKVQSEIGNNGKSKLGNQHKEDIPNYFKFPTKNTVDLRYDLF